MNEWVYVLTIEALIFGLVSTTLIAQRIDVFTWPSDQTWPVFGTCVLVLLVYSLLLVFVCNVVKASRLDALTENVSHGMARGAGRLITAAALWVVLQSVSVYTFEKREWPLVLCQLWGTTCKNPGSVFWEFSYSVYLSILLPILAWFGGLQAVVCGRMASEKITRKTPSRRSMNVNILSILVIVSAYTIEESFSLACKGKCPVGPDDLSIFDQQPGRKQVMSMQVLFENPPGLAHHHSFASNVGASGNREGAWRALARDDYVGDFRSFVSPGVYGHRRALCDVGERPLVVCCEDS
jgi:hypothetical protein